PLVPTHAKDGKGGLPPWVGWYAAVADLLPSCPESKLADWQLRRLRETPTFNLLVTNQNDQPKGVEGRAPRTFAPQEPAGPVLADSCSRTRALLVNGIPDNHAGDMTGYEAGRDAPPVTASQDKHPQRALLLRHQGDH